jgi:4'-phosphopantetheinyl transferase
MRLIPLSDLQLPGIEIHRLDLELNDVCAWQAWDEITPVERVRARRFALHADCARFVQTRAAVRRLLAHRLACRPADVSLGLSPYGKPYVVGEAESVPLFNVSHTGLHALIAVADQRHVTHLGVDIELQKNDFDTEVVLGMAFTARECREVRIADDILYAFYQRWVGKEAVLKAIGVGVTEHLQCVGVHPDANGGIDIVCTVSEWRGVKAMALPVPLGYAAALAWQTKEPI